MASEQQEQKHHPDHGHGQGHKHGHGHGHAHGHGHRPGPDHSHKHKRRRGHRSRPLGAPSADNIRFLEEDGTNVFADSVEQGHRLDPRARVIFIVCVVAIVVYFVGLIFPKDLLNQGIHYSGYSAGYSLAWFISDLQENVNGLVGVFTGNDTAIVPFSSTMIRYLVIMLAGAGLALCGAVYQGAFRNALVSPSSLGVMSGASLGLIVWVLFCVSDDGDNPAWVESLVNTSSTAAGTGLDDLWSLYSLSVFSFVGCAIVVALVLLTLRLAGRKVASGIMIIIVGQAIGGVAGAVAGAVRYYYVTVDPYGVKASLLTELSIASFYRTFTWIDLVAVAIPIVICVLVVMHFRQKMMVLAFGKEEARTMGVDVQRIQFLVVGVCTLLTAIIISFCGSIGFVGFLVPHLSRRLVGPNFKYLIPASMAVGAVFVLVAYVLVAVTLGPTYETMSGMFLSIGGAAVFLVTALRGKGGKLGGFQQ